MTNHYNSLPWTYSQCLDPLISFFTGKTITPVKSNSPSTLQTQAAPHGWRKTHNHTGWCHFTFITTDFKWVLNVARPSRGASPNHSVPHCPPWLFHTILFLLNFPPPPPQSLHSGCYYTVTTEVTRREITHRLVPSHHCLTALCSASQPMVTQVSGPCLCLLQGYRSRYFALLLMHDHFFLSIASFPSAYKPAAKSPILKKYFLLTLLRLPTITPF